MDEEDLELIPLIAPSERTRVQDTIDRLEKRAAAGEEFAQKALPAWRRELGRIERGEIY
jgi:hypothetical protein